MATNRTGRRPVQSVETAFSLLEHLKAVDGATLSALAGEFDLAKSTIHRHLKTLEQRGYVVEERDVYHPSLRFVDLGEYARTRRPEYEEAGRKVEKLVELTGEQAGFAVEEHERAVLVHRGIGENAVRADSHLGKRFPLHATAGGKAVLASLPADRVDRIVEARGLEAYTQNTTTDPTVLREELDRIRAEGIAFNQAEFIEGLHALAVPVRSADDELLGALTVSGPGHRFQGAYYREELPDVLLEVANELELDIRY